MFTLAKFISDLRNLDSVQRRTLKADQLTTLTIPRTARADMDIEVVGIERTDFGISVLVRAWRKDGTQIGFGDGTIDVERFKIHMADFGTLTNLEWLIVPDLSGLISIDSPSTLIDGTPIVQTTKYRFDPKEHLLMYLERIIGGLSTHGHENIVVGKVGNTVSTFTPHSSDGVVANTGTVWTTLRDATSGVGVNNSVQDEWLIGYDNDGGSMTNAGLFLPFDTSSIPDTDSISAATLLVRQTGNAGEGGRSFALTQTSQASDTALVADDYDQRGHTGSEGATRVTMNTANTDWTFTLNATGRGWISKTGYTKLGICAAGDIDYPTTAPTVRNYTRLAHSENTTAAYRPTLTVTHATSAVTIANAKTFNGVPW